MNDKLANLEMMQKSARSRSEQVKVKMLILGIIINVVVFFGLTLFHNQIFDGVGNYTGCQVQLHSSPLTSCNQNDSIAFVRSIMNETGTDKLWRHSYHRMYGRLFATMQNDRIRLIEIGVKDGNSVKLWPRYFPNYEHIYGIGYKNFQTERKDVRPDNITLYMGDQSDASFLKYVCEDAGAPFDIIIDDGSHHITHQMVSLQNLMNCLKPGGYYIIEDIETSYWNVPGAELYGYKYYGYGLYSNTSFVELAKKFVDVINRQYHQKMDMKFLEIDHQIASIMFEQNLVVIRKVDEWDTGLHDKSYENCNIKVKCNA